MPSEDTVTVEVVETVHVPGHGLVYAGDTEKVPQTDELGPLVTAGALRKPKPKTGAQASETTTKEDS